LRNNQDNCLLHRFTTSKPIARMIQLVSLQRFPDLATAVIIALTL